MEKDMSKEKASSDLKEDNMALDACEGEYLCVHPMHVGTLIQNLPNEKEVTAMADFFKAFSDMTRVRILCALWEHELCVCDISTLLGMTPSAISHQLRFLRQSRLITCRREGKTVFYSLADEHVQSIINCAKEHVNE